jgi:abequosyltransferase
MKLSICIPTYNRRDTLRELLDSIVQQLRAGVEVVIANDASPDDTAGVMASYVGRIPNLVLHSHTENIGLDANYQAVAELASGEYLWMMGDDDRLEPGAVDTVISLLAKWRGVVGMTVGVLDYDNKLQTATGKRHMPDEQVARGVEELFTKIPEHLGFMSALIIRRESWMYVHTTNPVERFHNLYSQVYVIGRAVGSSGRWGISPAICVAFRSDNDQFQRRLGWFERLRADVLAYGALSQALLGHAPAASKTMMDRIIKTHVAARVRSGKLDGLSNVDFIRTIKLGWSQLRYQRAFWSHIAPTLVMPQIALRFARTAYKRMNPNSGAWRARAAR